MEVKKIYFDLDGVLADFNKGLIELCKFEPFSINEENVAEKKDKMWKVIRNVDHFFCKLELKKDEKKLFDKIYLRYQDKVEILTGIPKPKRNVLNVSEDKKEWVKKMLSKDLVVHTVFKEEKVKYCIGKGYILIDDSQKNINAWNEQGGTGILHKNVEDTLKELKLLGIM